MSAEVFRLVILGICAVSIAIATYYEGKTKGFVEGFDSGYELGCMAGEFKALIELDMDKAR